MGSEKSSGTESRISTCENTQTEQSEILNGCYNEVALGSNGTSLDFSTAGGQVNTIQIPSSGSQKIRFASASGFESALEQAKIGDFVIIYSINNTSYNVDIKFSIGRISTNNNSTAIINCIGHGYINRENGIVIGLSVNKSNLVMEHSTLFKSGSIGKYSVDLTKCGIDGEIILRT